MFIIVNFSMCFFPFLIKAVGILNRLCLLFLNVTKSSPVQFTIYSIIANKLFLFFFSSTVFVTRIDETT
jgi:hypothetical protein